MGPADADAAGWPRWAAAVRDALARKSLSVNAAAEYLGVRNTTLRRWLDGAAPPQLTLTLPDELLAGDAATGDGATDAERLELARRYLGAEGGDAYIAANPGGSQVMIRMTPEHWLSVDYGRA